MATAAESAEAGRRFGPTELLGRLSGYRDFFTGGDPSQAGAYATFLLEAFGRAYAQATGELTP